MQRETHRARFPLLFEFLFEQFREKHEMVIVDPDQVSIGCRIGNRFGEELVDLFVRVPCFVIE